MSGLGPMVMPPDNLPQEDLALVASEWVERASVAWPDIAPIPKREFIDYVTERLSEDTCDLESLRAMRAEDLYIACACTRHDLAAIQAVETRYFNEIDRALGRQGAVHRDETLQRVREKLWVGKGGAPAKIALYAGRGHLRRWLRILIHRCITDQVRQNAREARCQRELCDVLPTFGDDPHLVGIGRAYRNEFRVSFEQAIRALTSEQRLLLRQHYLDSLTLEELAKIHRIHPVTVSRRIAKAKRAVVVAMRRSLRNRLQLQANEIESLMGLVESQLDLTLSRILRVG